MLSWKLLPALVTSLASFGVACASTTTTTTTTSAPPVPSLPDGHQGVVSFESVTPENTTELVTRGAHAKAWITGTLSFPEAATGPVPAVVVLHGSSGVKPGEWVWAKRMNEMGFASFVVDSFTGRGIKNTEADQGQLSMSADIADAYMALRLLSTNPRIDKKRVGVMGFSRGGIAALYSSLDPFRRAVIDDDLRFAAHVAFYPSCGIHYTSAHLDGAPILMLLGGKDDYTPAPPCLEYADDLRAKGAQVIVKTYPEAYHGFDRPTPIRVVKRATSARECHGNHDLDTNEFTMRQGDRTVSGAEASAESKRCLSLGVTLGGDPVAREQAPVVVAEFLRSVFGTRK
jgi:dienelactone hydrolase